MSLRTNDPARGSSGCKRSVPPLQHVPKPALALDRLKVISKPPMRGTNFHPPSKRLPFIEREERKRGLQRADNTIASQQQRQAKEDSRRRNPDDSSDSFEADDNANELDAIVPSADVGHEYFEAEMHRHGLLDKILHIQQLNNYFGAELGSARKGSPRAGNASPEPSVSGLNTSSAADKGYAFPFQKRARSNSPPRSPSALFSSGTHKVDSKTGRKPVVATPNFVIGKIAKQRQFGPRAECSEQSAAKDGEECCGLSTGPTDEERNNVLRQEMAPTGDDWMYQRIVGNEESECADLAGGGDLLNEMAKKNDGKGSFLQLLGSAKLV